MTERKVKERKGRKEGREREGELRKQSWLNKGWGVLVLIYVCCEDDASVNQSLNTSFDAKVSEFPFLLNQWDSTRESRSPGDSWGKTLTTRASHLHHSFGGAHCGAHLPRPGQRIRLAWPILRPEGDRCTLNLAWWLCLFFFCFFFPTLSSKCLYGPPTWILVYGTFRWDSSQGAVC